MITFSSLLWGFHDWVQVPGVAARTVLALVTAMTGGSFRIRRPVFLLLKLFITAAWRRERETVCWSSKVCLNLLAHKVKAARLSIKEQASMHNKNKLWIPLLQLKRFVSQPLLWLMEQPPNSHPRITGRTFMPHHTLQHCYGNGSGDLKGCSPSIS